MNSSTLTNGTSGSAALSLVVIVQWLLAQIHIQLPADVATACSVVMSFGLHWLIENHKMPDNLADLATQLMAAKMAASSPVPPAPPAA